MLYLTGHMFTTQFITNNGTWKVTRSKMRYFLERDDRNRVKEGMATQNNIIYDRGDGGHSVALPTYLGSPTTYKPSL